ncbi:hypothetical protein [Nocardia heshunensis]
MADSDVPRGSSSRARGGRRRQPLEAEFEIVVVEGLDGELLARRQAEVLWEITRWQASRQK